MVRSVFRGHDCSFEGESSGMNRRSLYIVIVFWSPGLEAQKSAPHKLMISWLPTPNLNSDSLANDPTRINLKNYLKSRKLNPRRTSKY